jgi:DNA polymerase-3 subunit epsilon
MSDCREIVIDTETTGLSHKDGDKIIEIGCVEILNKSITKNYLHLYINPNGREISKEAFEVHGISEEFLSDKPIFKEITNQFLDFIGNNNIIIHNAAFDIGFLNKELSLTGHNPINIGRVVDTLLLARRRFPGAPASLDALCRKYNINLDVREKHGALIDAELLAQVYLILTGNNQSSLDLLNSDKGQILDRKTRPYRSTKISEQTDIAHKNFINKKLTNHRWNQAS